MISSWELYLLQKLDVTRDLFILLTIVLAGALLMVFAHYVVETSEETDKELIKKIKKKSAFTGSVLLSGTVVVILLAAYIPTTKEAAVIIIVPKVLNSKFVQEDFLDESKDLYFMAKKWVKRQLKEKGLPDGKQQKNNATQTKNEQKKSDKAI